ncbi:DUF6887 family protein [Crocosphaera sp. Alani8]|uniref:DUF6887 family protein n=1 Tax=Crocosphaera sp. Alani8 TaxID=3038952 RepID=UPI00313C53B7
MTKPNYKNMNRAELKQYLLSNRNDQDAWNSFFEKLSNLDSDIGYSSDLSSEEMEKLFKTKLKQTNLE